MSQVAINKQNLRDIGKLPREERQRLGSLGGIASGKAKRAKRTWREITNTLLDTPLKDGQVDEKIKSLASAKGLNITAQTAIVLKQVVNAINGDNKAAEFVLNVSGGLTENDEPTQDTFKRVDLTEVIIPHFDVVSADIKRHRHTHYWLTGGRGSTKSSFAGTEVVDTLMNNKDCHAVVLRKVGQTLKNSVYAQIEWCIDKLGVSDKFTFKKSPLEIIYNPTGQRILFLGVDDPQKVKSIKLPFGYVGIVWFEELDQFAGMNEIRNINQSLLRGGDKYWCFYSFNPPKSRDNWVNVEQLTDDADRMVIKSDYTMVPVEWLGQQFVNEAEKLKEARPDLYAHEYMGEVTGTGGDVFPNVEELDITDELIDTFDNVFHGIDFGFATDPFVYMKMNYDEKHDTIYIYDEVYGTKLTNKKAVNLIKDKVGDRPVYCDSAEPKSIAEFTELGIRAYPVRKGPDSRDFSIKWLSDRAKIYIDKKRCPNAYREFMSYEFAQDKDGNFISSYPKHNDHTIDAVRYGLREIMDGARFSW